MQTSKLRVGTITANYNAGKYFPECLSGLMAQSLKPDIITVIDDASTDDSVTHILNAAKVFTNDPISSELIDNITVYKVKFKNGTLFELHRSFVNKGPAGARNIGLVSLLDRTDIICIADCDDILYPLKISKSVDIMKKYSHVGLVYSDYDTFDERTGKKTREYKEPFSYHRLLDECIVSNNSVIATSMLKIVGKYDESLRGPEDYDMWLRIAEIAAAYHIPEALYQYRLTGNNITITTPSAKFSEQVVKVKQKAYARKEADV
jgi:glycosyltransferase involved in cell wall biosynthesis